MSWGRDPLSGLLLPGSVAPSSTALDGSPADAVALLKEDIRHLLIDLLHDKVGHAMAVAAGESQWRAVFMKQYGACFLGNTGQCDHLANVLFRFIRTTWRERYHPDSATAFLDSVHIPSPLSEAEQEREIEDAWEVEIGSSDLAMQQHYVGAARTRRGKDAFASWWHRPQK